MREQQDETNGGASEGESRSVWRYAKVDRARLIVDAADYFELIRQAMMKSRQSIFLIGWDFDTRILLSNGRRWWDMPRKERFPARLGSFIAWLEERDPELEIRLLKWNFSLFKSVFRGTMVLDLLRWARRDRIFINFDSAHPIGCSHHQKIVVLDDKVAVCGGIDMTSDRWDTPEHLPHDPRRTLPGGGRRLYDPWHDVTMMMEGEVALALGDLGRERWKVAKGEPFEPCRPQEETPWPDELEPDFTDVEVGIARTRAEYGDCCQIAEIEELFVEQIARAKRFVYAETQYFASRAIAEAICARLTEPDPPEFCIVNPVTADGWLEQVAMDSARVELVRAIGEVDHARRFRIFTPLASDGTPIYVHSKLTIVDDEILRVGSANMNNRSLGLDSECDVFLDARRPANSHIGPRITEIRHRLLAEHCGISIEDVGEGLRRHDTMAAMIEALGQTGKRLVPLVLKDLTEAEKALAKAEVLDPERPSERFEPIGKRGLFRRRGVLRRIYSRLRWKDRRKKSG